VRVTPAPSVRAGDEVRLRQDGRERVVVVVRVIAKRPASIGPPLSRCLRRPSSPATEAKPVKHSRIGARHLYHLRPA
jgi:ribosome-associated heat shock protein Hsp15